VPRAAILVVSLTVVLVASVAPAVADEAKTPLSAAMILSIVSSPVDTRTSAFDAGLKDSAARPSDGATTGEVLLADGSVRYGRTVITVRNPCPPGEHFEVPMLPGRRGR
jgi:hypothetical protein